MSGSTAAAGGGSTRHGLWPVMAEVMAVEQITRWRAEVSRFAPERLEEFDGLIADALDNPAPVQKTASWAAG